MWIYRYRLIAMSMNNIIVQQFSSTLYFSLDKSCEFRLYETVAYFSKGDIFQVVVYFLNININ